MKKSNYGNRNDKPTTTIEQKIELFREYLNDKNTSGRIVQSTVYKGYPIGSMVNTIRSELKKKKAMKKYTPEVIKELEELGLLDKRHESTIMQKVVRLSDFCKTYPIVWSLKSEEPKLSSFLEKVYSKEEQKEIRKKLSIAIKDYNYIYTRMILDRLSPKLYAILRECNVGYSFGYKEKIEYLVQTAGIQAANRLEIYDEEKRMAYIKGFRRSLYVADICFGGLENYQKMFKEKVLDGMDWKFPIIVNGVYVGDYTIDRQYRIAYICRLDINDNEMIYSRKADEELLTAIYGNVSPVVNGKIIESKLKRALSKISSNDKDEIIKQRYGIDCKKKTLKDIAKSRGTSDEAVRQKIEGGIFQLRKHDYVGLKNGGNCLEADREEELINKFFDLYGIFNISDTKRLEDDDKSTLRGIIEKGLEEREALNKKMELAWSFSGEEMQYILKKAYGENVNVGELRYLSRREKNSYIRGKHEIMSVDTLPTEVRMATIKGAVQIQEIQDIMQRYMTKEKMILRRGFIRIENLNLLSSTLECLKNADIKTVAQLLRLSKKEILEIRNIGEVRYNEIEQAIHSVGFLMHDEAKEDEQCYDKEKDSNFGKEADKVGDRLPKDVSIDELDLSIRVYNALRRAGIVNLQDILEMSNEEMASIRTIGKMGVEELIGVVHEIGYITHDELVSDKKRRERMEMNEAGKLLDLSTVRKPKAPSEEEIEK